MEQTAKIPFPNSSKESARVVSSSLDKTLNVAFATPASRSQSPEASPVITATTPFSRYRRRQSSSRSPSSSPLLAAAQLPGSSPNRSRGGSPGLANQSALVADVQTSKSRLLISKTHILYPPPSPLVPYPHAIIGFRVIFHPLSQTRYKDCEIRFTFLPRHGSTALPVIKALYPSHRSSPGSRELPLPGTQVTLTHTISGGATLGFDPFGTLHLDGTKTMEASYSVHPFIQGSGIETNIALFSLREDPISNNGIEQSLDVAIMVQLDDADDCAFSADMTVEATISGRSQDALRKFLGSPRVFRLDFDGVNEFGNIKIGQTAQLIPPPQESSATSALLKNAMDLS